MLKSIAFRRLPSAVYLMFLPFQAIADSELKVAQFCLTGEFNIGARYQGMAPQANEFYPTKWCVTSDNQSDTTEFQFIGKYNPDMDAKDTIKYIPPSTVQLLADNGNVNVMFEGAMISNDALRHKRMDPEFLLQELKTKPDWIISQSNKNDIKSYQVRYPNNGFISEVTATNNKLTQLKTWADLPLRGRVPITWNWSWSKPNATVTIHLEDDVLFRAAASRTNNLDRDIWTKPPAKDTPKIPGKAWPAKQAMSIKTIAENTFLVTNVRTGFHHLVVKTNKGLVVADAPAGWVEIQTIPPTDLTPGLGISGLSEMFIDFLSRQWPDIPIYAVVVTHFHDDHAGGARAFAARGAKVFSHKNHQAFLQKALNRSSMPTDQLSMSGNSVLVTQVADILSLDTLPKVTFYPLPKGPHSDAGLALAVPSTNILFVSDIHVPSNNKPEPREEKLATDCWFAKWSVSSLPAETLVFNSHNTNTTPVTRLMKYLENDACLTKE